MAEVIELQKLKVGSALNVYLSLTLGEFISKRDVVTVVSGSTRQRSHR